MVIGENKEHSRMPRRLSVSFKILERPRHTEVQSQPELIISAYKQMFAMTATRFEAAAFQSSCKLSRRDVFQNICVPHVDIGDPLMQRRGIKISLEHFNLRQLWHLET